MSQEKVNRYKEEKANRKELLAKKKREERLWKIGGGIIVLALAVWIGYSAVSSIANAPAAPVEADITAVSDYVDGLSE